MPDTPLPAACLSFTASADIAANAARIRAAIAAAARGGARLLLTPECALTGYPGAARESFAGIDWCAVADEEERLEAEARSANVAVVLGTASRWEHRLPDGTVAEADDSLRSRNAEITNDALVLGTTPKPLRYRKRCLTPLDAKHFVASEACGPCLIRLDGWTLGLTICFELRFGALWAEQAEAGADAFVTIAHMAGPDPDSGTKATVIPSLYTARAAEWATPLLLANTAAPDRWLDTAHWDARGVRVASQADRLLSTALTPRDRLDPWYSSLRTESLRRLAASAALANP